MNGKSFVLVMRNINIKGKRYTKMTVYEIMKALKYQKFIIKENDGTDIYGKSFDFSDLMDAIKYEEINDEILEKDVAVINLEQGYILLSGEA